MKLLRNSLTAGMLLSAATAVHAAEWVLGVDFEEYAVTSDESQIIAQGWVFQDWDFLSFIECDNGNRDCTGVREIVDATALVPGSNGKAILIRAVDHNTLNAANARSATGFDLPEAAWIPVGTTATAYMRFAAVDRNISFHWGFSAHTEPTGDGSEPPRLDYSSLGTSAQLDFGGTFGDRLNVFTDSSFWQPSTQDNSKIIEDKVWYELWYHINNASVANDGPYFDLYIRGGVFGDGEPVHLPNYLWGDARTYWYFRYPPLSGQDGPIARFVNVANSKNPTQTPARSGAMLFDDIYIKHGEFTLETPDVVAPEPWNGYAVDSNGWADTGDWLGYVYVSHTPWIYLEATGWAYYGSGDSEAEGGWIYALKN